MAEVTLKHIKKVYPNTEKKSKKGQKKSNLMVTDEGVLAVQDFNLDIKDREFIVLVGPSGCGKSTTLRMVAGLEEISGGELLIDGKRMNDVAPKGRDIPELCAVSTYDSSREHGIPIKTSQDAKRRDE